MCIRDRNYTVRSTVECSCCSNVGSKAGKLHPKRISAIIKYNKSTPDVIDSNFTLKPVSIYIIILNINIMYFTDINIY